MSEGVRIVPMNGWVLVELVEGKTDAGLILPEGDGAGPLPAHARVVRPSGGWCEGGMFVETRLKPGDMLMMDPDAPHVKHRDLKRGKVYHYLHERNCIAIVEEANAPN